MHPLEILCDNPQAVDRQVPRCSFCGKTQGQVRLVAGPSHVYICHLCVALCNEILAQDAPTVDRSAGAEPTGRSEPLIRTEITSWATTSRPETAGR